MREKKERTFWNIKESSIDKSLLKKIEKNYQITRLASVFFVICCCLYCIIFILSYKDYISNTVLLVFAIIYLVAALSILILDIVSAVKLQKLKKEVLESQKQNSVSSSTDETESSVGSKDN